MVLHKTIRCLITKYFPSWCVTAFSTKNLHYYLFRIIVSDFLFMATICSTIRQNFVWSGMLQDLHHTIWTVWLDKFDFFSGWSRRKITCLISKLCSFRFSISMTMKTTLPSSELNNASLESAQLLTNTVSFVWVRIIDISYTLDGASHTLDWRKLVIIPCSHTNLNPSPNPNPNPNPNQRFICHVLNFDGLTTWLDLGLAMRPSKFNFAYWEHGIITRKLKPGRRRWSFPQSRQGAW